MNILLITLSIIIILTFLQRYYYKMLNFIKNKSHSRIKYFIGIFIRTGVIIHEICHLFFGFFSGSKILEISLFKKDGGLVKYETKNYIGALPDNYQKNLFFVKLFLNQFGIFFTSIGPLLFGIVINYIIFKYYWNIESLSDLQVNINFVELNLLSTLLIIIYIAFVPSFVLSFTDLSNFIISKQETRGSTIIGSIINSVIFGLFLGILSLFVQYLILFFVSFGISFLFTLIVYISFVFFIKINTLSKTKSN